MRITIDNVAKTIKVEEKVPLDELVAYLQEINIDFTEYSLIAGETIIQYYPQQMPWIQPSPFYTNDKYVVTCQELNTNFTNK